MPFTSDEPQSSATQQPSREVPNDYGPRNPAVPRRIHILGTGSIGKLVAHSLRGIGRPPAITLLFHRHKLLKAWEESKKEITIETDGYKVARGGFDAELAVSRSREHRVQLKEGMPSVYEDADLRPHEAAAKLKDNLATFEPFNAQTGGDAESKEPIHNLIVTVKAASTVSAIAAVAHRLTPDSTICFLQNGMGIIDDVNEALFPDPATRPNYIQGIVSHGVNTPMGSDPFFAIHAGHGTIALGILPRDSDSEKSTGKSKAAALKQTVVFPPTARYLIRTLTRTPVLAAVGLAPHELFQHQLEKLAINAVINPLTVMLDARNGSILYNFAITRTMRLLLAEISLVLRSLPELRGLPNVEHRFSPERLETLVVSVAWKTRENVSSMLADVRSVKQTEVKWINGYVVKRGEEMGIQPVCNYMIMQMVLGKANMVKREVLDQVPVNKEDLTGEGFKTE